MAKRKSDDPPSFEAALKELEGIARDLEEGALGLDGSLQRFEEGIGLLRHCYGVLDTAERKIAVLTGVDADGNPVTEPFDATATAEQGTAGRRKTRRDASAAPTEPESESSAGRGLF